MFISQNEYFWRRKSKSITMKLPMQKKIVTVSAIAITLIITAISLISIRQIENVNTTTESLILTQEILSQTHKAVSLTTHYAINARSFLATGNSSFTETAAQRRASIITTANSLKNYNINNPQQKVLLDSMLELISESLASSDKLFAAKKEASLPAGFDDKAYTNTNKLIIELMQNIAAQVYDYENDLSEQQKKDAAKETSILKTIFYLSFLAFVLILILVMRKILSDLNLQKQINERLDYLGKMVDSTNDAVILFDTNFIIQSWNKGAEKIYGYSQSEVIGKDFAELIKSTDSKEEISCIKKRLAEGEIWSGEVIQTTKKNQVVNILCTTLSIKSNNTITGYVAVNRDISEQKKMDAHVAALAKMVENTKDAIILTDKELNIEMWNKGAENLYGYRQEDVLGKNAVSVVGTQYKPGEKDAILEKMNQGFWAGEVKQIKMNGDTIDVFGTITTLKDHTGNITNFVAVNHDVSETKKAEEELAHFAKMISSSKTAIISINEDLYITSWNHGAEMLYGYTAEEAIGKWEADFLPTQTSHALSIANEVKQIEVGGYWNGECEHKKKDGEIIVVDISITVFYDHKHNQKSFLTFISNITEKKKIEDQLKKFNEELEQKVNEKTGELKDIFERVTDGFVALDKNWRYTYVNKKGGEILRRDPDYLIGKNIWDEFSDPKANAHFYKAYHKAMDEQKYVYFEDYFEPFSFWLENHIYPSQNGISIYFRDVTEQKQAQTELVKMNYRFRNLSGHLQNSREDERMKIAREIHDELGQSTTALKINMSWLSKKNLSEDVAVKNRIDDTISLLNEMVKSIRRISQELRPSILDNLGLSAAIEWFTSEFEKRTGIKCTFENKLLDDSNLTNNVKTALFRICQESLTNVMRHSQATAVDCTLQRMHNKIVLDIHDNGKGFDITQKNKSFGLLGMQERASMINGNLKIESAPNKGTTIHAEIEL